MGCSPEDVFVVLRALRFQVVSLYESRDAWWIFERSCWRKSGWLVVNIDCRLEMYLRISILEFVGTYGLVRIGH